MVGNSEKHSTDAHAIYCPPGKTICDSRDATWLHKFFYLPRPGNNLDIKAGDSVMLSNNTRHPNLGIVNDTIENNADLVDNNSENKNNEESYSESNNGTADNNEWITVPKSSDSQKATKKLELLTQGDQ